MTIEITSDEAALILQMIEKQPTMGLEAMKMLVLLACKLQVITNTPQPLEARE